MERCPNCGNRLNSIDVLCPKCGTVVEVIQIKSNISSASETAQDTAPTADIAMKQKEFPENFVVYNEDFPADDENSEHKKYGEADNIDDVLSETVIEAAAQEPPAMLSFNEDLSQPEREFDITDAAQIPAPDGQGAIERQPETPDEDGYDYSERYLENLKNINLPEIDDLQAFDPEEFMREYKRSKSQPEAAQLYQQPVPEKKWLEIEETFETEDPFTESKASEAADTDVTATRRYRAVERNVKSRGKKSERAERINKTPEKRSKTKKYNVAVTILLWLVVSAAFLCGFIFFDKYVQKAYGSYDSFIYTITDGKIDVDPAN